MYANSIHASIGIHFKANAFFYTVISILDKKNLF